MSHPGDTQSEGHLIVAFPMFFAMMVIVVLPLLIIVIMAMPVAHSRVGADQLARESVVLETQSSRPLAFEDAEAHKPKAALLHVSVLKAESVAAL